MDYGKTGGATDVLIWQEPLGDVLPGIMNGILEDIQPEPRHHHS